MFIEVLDILGNHYVANGYNIAGQINRALESSNHHNIVALALNELNDNNIDLQHFNRETLRNVWEGDVYSFTTKYLVTLWWGNVDHRLFNRVYSAINMNRLQEIAQNLENNLLIATECENTNEFLIHIRHLFREMMNNGDLYLSYISSAFFTKVLQFYFASHPIQAQNNYIPIIADQWLMKAVYCELTDLGRYEDRDNMFIINANNSIALHNNNAESYANYVNFFNNRSIELETTSWYLEGCLFRNHIVLERYNELVNNYRTQVIPEYQNEYEALINRNLPYRIFGSEENIPPRIVFFGCKIDDGLRLYVGNKNYTFCSIIGNNLTPEIREKFRDLLPISGKDWIAKKCSYEEAVQTLNLVLDRLQENDD